jgi:hypothetical protein
MTGFLLTNIIENLGKVFLADERDLVIRINLAYGFFDYVKELTQKKEGCLVLVSALPFSEHQNYY